MRERCRRLTQRVPDFLAVNNAVGLFPELDFRKLAIMPAVADDAVLRRRFAGEIIRLRGAGDGGKGGRDVRERAAFPEFRDARRVRADERVGEADDVDDGEPAHFPARARSSAMAAAMGCGFISWTSTPRPISASSVIESSPPRCSRNSSRPDKIAGRLALSALSSSSAKSLKPSFSSRFKIRAAEAGLSRPIWREEITSRAMPMATAS